MYVQIINESFTRFVKQGYAYRQVFIYSFLSCSSKISIHVSFTQPNTGERHACHKNSVFDTLISTGGQPDLRSGSGKATALNLVRYRFMSNFVYFNFPLFTCQNILF